MDAATLDPFDRGVVDHQIPARHTGHCECEDAEQDGGDESADPSARFGACLGGVSILCVITKQDSHVRTLELRSAKKMAITIQVKVVYRAA